VEFGLASNLSTNVEWIRLFGVCYPSLQDDIAKQTAAPGHAMVSCKEAGGRRSATPSGRSGRSLSADVVGPPPIACSAPPRAQPRPRAQSPPPPAMAAAWPYTPRPLLRPPSARTVAETPNSSGSECDNHCC
jgi:hypothetical protein